MSWGFSVELSSQRGVPNAELQLLAHHSRCLSLGYVLLAFKDMLSPRRYADDLPHSRFADIQLLENMTRSRHDDRVLDSRSRNSM